jgi:hypothetical protein
MSYADDVRELAGLEPGAAVPCATAAHEHFAQALATHGNKLAAYRDAYPDASQATVRVEAYTLANHADVARRVLELQKANREHILRETEDLEAIVANLCHGKPARLLDEEGNPLPLHMLPRDVQDAIKGLKLKVIRDEAGNVVSEYEVTFPDPLQALKLLAQLRGALVERHDLTSAGRALQPAIDPRDLPQLDAELRKRLLESPEQPPEDNSDLIS